MEKLQRQVKTYGMKRIYGDVPGSGRLGRLRYNTRMTHDTGENSNTAVCRAADADAQGEPVLRSAVGGSGLFQRQLSAVGLGDVAEKIAAGSALEWRSWTCSAGQASRCWGESCS